MLAAGAASAAPATAAASATPAAPAAPAAAASAATASAASASADSIAPIELVDDRGRTLTLSAPPKRIVSLLPSLTETVCALGACDRLVGTDRFSNWPASVGSLPKLGGMDDVQIERVVALKPDLVLAGADSRALDRLAALGQPLLVLRTETHADVRRTLLRVATVLGQEQAGVAAWSRIADQVREAERAVPPALKGQRIYFEVDATPYAAGTVSFIGETLAQLGLGNVVPAAYGPFPKLNPEWVLRARPDIVIGAERAVAEMASRPGWSRMTALRDGRRCGFEPARFDVLVRPGPRLGEAAALLAGCLRQIADRGTR